MFETNVEMDEKGLTVPYPPLFDNIRKIMGSSILADGRSWRRK